MGIGEGLRSADLTAALRGIDRHGLPARVLENPLDHRRFLDAGNDAQPTAALPAGLGFATKTVNQIRSTRVSADGIHADEP